MDIEETRERIAFLLYLRGPLGVSEIERLLSVRRDEIEAACFEHRWFTGSSKSMRSTNACRTELIFPALAQDAK